MSQYDDNNSGVCFPPFQDQSLMAQGRINIEGREDKYAVIYERLKKDGPLTRVLYQKVGVLFDNSEGKEKNEKAPDFSGPLDLHPNHRVAAWRGHKDGRNFLSIKVSEKQGGSGGASGGQGAAGANAGWGAPNAGAQPAGGTQAGYSDDEIPF